MPNQNNAKHLITPRPIRFKFQGPVERYWYQNNMAGTMFLNILAGFIPHGEKFFIKSVKAFKSQIQDPKLISATNDFIKQESFHSREHLHFYNRYVKPFYPGILKYPIELIIPTLVAQILGPKFRLSITAAGEHFTAVIAHVFLSHPELFDNVDEDIKAMWQWHCIEEIEHKSVAFDVLQELKIGYFWRMSGFLGLNFLYLLGFLRPIFYIMFKDRAFFRPPSISNTGAFTLANQKLSLAFLVYFMPTSGLAFILGSKIILLWLKKMIHELNGIKDNDAQQAYLRQINQPPQGVDSRKTLLRFLKRKKQKQQALTK